MLQRIEIGKKDQFLDVRQPASIRRDGNLSLVLDDGRNDDLDAIVEHHRPAR